MENKNQYPYGNNNDDNNINSYNNKEDVNPDYNNPYGAENQTKPFEPEIKNDFENQNQYSNAYSNYPPTDNHQTTQWTFNDYPQQKNNKKDKKPKGKNAGIKVFAVVMSVLFFLTATTLAGYVWYTSEQDDDLGSLPHEDIQTPDDEIATKPSMDIIERPDSDNTNVVADTGVLTTPSIYKKVNPSVVGIITYVKTTGYQASGEGSGVILSKDGYIVTNAHVVQSNDARYSISKIEVVLNNKETYTARVLGADTKSDLAVLKIEADNLTPAEFGDSDALEIGDTVIVIGNPSGVVFAGSLTQGVVSAVNREVNSSDTGETMTYIQTDAAINPGNSGGALVNQYGQVVGISSAKIAATDYEGIGFAIPTSIAKPIIDSIIENGYVTGRVKIGISYMSISETLSLLNGIPMGARVIEVDPTFDVASKVQPGDIITKMDGIDIVDQQSISTALKDKKPGDSLQLTLYRVNESGVAKTLNVNIILGEDTPVATQ